MNLIATKTPKQEEDAKVPEEDPKAKGMITTWKVKEELRQNPITTGKFVNDNTEYMRDNACVHTRDNECAHKRVKESAHMRDDIHVSIKTLGDPGGIIEAMYSVLPPRPEFWF